MFPKLDFKFEPSEELRNSWIVKIGKRGLSTDEPELFEAALDIINGNLTVQQINKYVHAIHLALIIFEEDYLHTLSAKVFRLFHEFVEATRQHLMTLAEQSDHQLLLESYGVCRFNFLMFQKIFVDILVETNEKNLKIMKNCLKCIDKCYEKFKLPKDPYLNDVWAEKIFAPLAERLLIASRVRYQREFHNPNLECSSAIRMVRISFDEMQKLEPWCLEKQNGNQLELAYLQDADVFHRENSAKKINLFSTNFFGYIKAIQLAIKHEMTRSGRHLSGNAQVEMKKKLVAIYIEPHLQLFLEQIIKSKQAKNTKQLKVVFEQMKLAGKEQCFFAEVDKYHLEHSASVFAQHSASFVDYVRTVQKTINLELNQVALYFSSPEQKNNPDYLEHKDNIKEKLSAWYIKPHLDLYTGLITELKRNQNNKLLKMIYEHLKLAKLTKFFVAKIEEYYVEHSAKLFETHSNPFVNYVNQISLLIKQEAAQGLCIVREEKRHLLGRFLNFYFVSRLGLYEDLIMELMKNKNYSQLVVTYKQIKLADRLDLIAEVYNKCYFDAEFIKLKHLSTFQNDKIKFNVKKVGEMLQNIYSVYENISEVVSEAFEDDPALKTARDKLMVALLNHESFKSQTVNSLDITVFSILLTFCANVLLRDANVTGQYPALESQFQKLCTLLKYINEKDYFTRIYRNNLVRRLLQANNIDYEPEEMAVNELKSIGIPVGKIVEMIHDSKISYDFYRKMGSELKNAENENDRVPDWVTARFLRKHCWISDQQAKVALKYPPGVEQALEKISRCYRSSFPNRNLTWHAPFSTAELTFYTESGTCYTLEVTSYQAMVLCAWNERDHSELSVDSLHLHTGIPKSQLSATLWSLVDGGKPSPPNSNKSSVLLMVGKPVKSWHAITDSTTFRLNLHFKCHKRKVNLIGQLPIHQQVLKDEAERLVQTRRILLQSAIAQTLKKHKTLSTNQIYLESAQILYWAFAPTKQDTVELINQLVSQGDVSRDKNQPDLLHFTLSTNEEEAKTGGNKTTKYLEGLAL